MLKEAFDFISLLGLSIVNLSEGGPFMVIGEFL
jgi:hypothetical protein